VSDQKSNEFNHEPASCTTRSLLMVAHPGHELRVHGWLEKARPIVCVLTDGSGRTNHSRLDSTTSVLRAADCIPGPIYGPMTDQSLYTAVMEFDHACFIDLVDQLAGLLIGEKIGCVGGDAAEGYNPAHDICRLIINAAVRLASAMACQSIDNFDFALVGPPEDCRAPVRSGAINLQLDEPAFARKLAAARNYPELQAEVATALEGAGSVGLQQHPDLVSSMGIGFTSPTADQFAVECLRPVETASSLHERDIPFYERYGERQVEAGHYMRVLRYHQHMLPLAAAITAHVQTSIGA
jgi:hypothetical protein